MFTLRIICFFIYIFPIFAIPHPRQTSNSFVVHEQRDKPPSHFKLNGSADPGKNITIRIALKSSNRDGLEDALYDASTPGSPKYGMYLSQAEIEEFVRPSQKTQSVVNSWLQENNLSATNSTSSGQFIELNVNVSTANRLFDASYQDFIHEDTNELVTRTLSVSLPERLQEHVNALFPATDFPPKKRIASPHTSIVSSQLKRSDPQPANLSTCVSSATTPTCLQALYGIPSSIDIPRTIGTANASRIGVTGFIEQFPQKADLEGFMTHFRPGFDPNVSFSLQVFEGGQDPQNASLAGPEANSDIEYTVGLAVNVSVTFISVGRDTHDIAGGLFDLFQFFETQEDLPQVISTSFGANEPDSPVSLSMAFCDWIMQISARGISVIFGSGDGGVSGIGTQSCTTFVPTFPSDCPYVTSVGATQNFAPEIATNMSGGGFSNVFPVPRYQQSVVKQYLDRLGNTNAGLFNRTGRGIPDVATHGTNLVVFNGGNSGITGGTSLSGPIFASIVAMANALRIEAGKSALGFLNPLLYNKTDLFTDITSGSNPGCNTDGFPAMSGWDPVTGLGTPNFDKFKELP